MKYLVWETETGIGYCTLEDIENVSDSYELVEGVSRLKGWPDDAAFRMKSGSPKAVKMADNIWSLRPVLIISGRIKEFLEKNSVPDVEYLRVSIINHKDRLTSSDYFIANALAVVDCIDKDKSEIEFNPLDPDSVCDCGKLVLRKADIPPTAVMFRPKHLETIILVQDKLAKAIEAHDFSGVDLVPSEEFSS